MRLYDTLPSYTLYIHILIYYERLENAFGVIIVNARVTASYIKVLFCRSIVYNTKSFQAIGGRSIG